MDKSHNSPLEMNLEKVKSLLSQDPDKRSWKDIQALSQEFHEIAFFKQYKGMGYGDVQTQCARYSQYEFIERNKAVFHIDTVGDKFYLILKGRVGIYIRLPKLSLKKPGEKEQDDLTCVKELGLGLSFGELALLNNKPRLASIICHEDSHFMTLDKKTFTLILKQKEEEKLIQEMVFFAKLPFFDGWNYNLIKLIYLNSFRIKYQKNEKIFVEGDEPTNVYIVSDGEFVIEKTFERGIEEDEFGFSQTEESDTLKVSSTKQKRQVQLAVLVKNELFGEEDIMNRETQRTYSVVCSTVSGECIVVKKRDFELRILHEEGARLYLEDRLRKKTQYKKEKMQKLRDSIGGFSNFFYDDYDDLKQKQRINEAISKIESPRKSRIKQSQLSIESSQSNYENETLKNQFQTSPSHKDKYFLKNQSSNSNKKLSPESKNGESPTLKTSRSIMIRKQTSINQQLLKPQPIQEGQECFSPTGRLERSSFLKLGNEYYETKTFIESENNSPVRDQLKKEQQPQWKDVITLEYQKRVTQSFNEVFKSKELNQFPRSPLSSKKLIKTFTQLDNVDSDAPSQVLWSPQMKKRRLKDDDNLFQPKLNRQSLLKLEGLNNQDLMQESSPVFFKYLNPELKKNNNHSNVIPTEIKDPDSLAIKGLNKSEQNLNYFQLDEQIQLSQPLIEEIELNKADRNSQQQLSLNEQTDPSFHQNKNMEVKEQTQQEKPKCLINMQRVIHSPSNYDQLAQQETSLNPLIMADNSISSFTQIPDTEIFSNGLLSSQSHHNKVQTKQEIKIVYNNSAVEKPVKLRQHFKSNGQNIIDNSNQITSDSSPLSKIMQSKEIIQEQHSHKIAKTIETNKQLLEKKRINGQHYQEMFDKLLKTKNKHFVEQQELDKVQFRLRSFKINSPSSQIPQIPQSKKMDPQNDQMTINPQTQFNSSFSPMKGVTKKRETYKFEEFRETYSFPSSQKINSNQNHKQFVLGSQETDKMKLNGKGAFSLLCQHNTLRDQNSKDLQLIHTRKQQDHLNSHNSSDQILQKNNFYFSSQVNKKVIPFQKFHNQSNSYQQYDTSYLNSGKIKGKSLSYLETNKFSDTSLEDNLKQPNYFSPLGLSSSKCSTLPDSIDKLGLNSQFKANQGSLKRQTLHQKSEPFLSSKQMLSFNQPSRIQKGYFTAQQQQRNKLNSSSSHNFGNIKNIDTQDKNNQESQSLLKKPV